MRLLRLIPRPPRLSLRLFPRHLIAALGLLVLDVGCSTPTAEPAVEIGDPDAGYILHVQPGSSPTVDLRRGVASLLHWDADGFQVGTVPALDSSKSYDPYWLENGQDVVATSPPDGLQWHSLTEAHIVDGESSATRLVLNLELDGGLGGRLIFERSASGRFAAQLIPDSRQTGLAVAFLRLRPRLMSDSEGLYGLGEWADDVNHRGKVRPMQMEVDTLESSDNENHVPVPLLIGTGGWGLFVESKRVGSFDVAHKQADAIEATYGTAEQSGDGLRFHLFLAERPLDILRRYYDVTGDPLLPAAWAYGPWLWRDEHRDQAQVLDDIAKIRSLDLAHSAIWIDRPYANEVNSFDFDGVRFPDPPAIVAAAHAAGLRMALWSAPYLEPSAPHHAEAVAQGYFPPTNSLLLNSWSPPIDFTNPQAYAAWQGWLSNYIKLGIEGFKLDYGEDVVPSFGDARSPWGFHDGSDERTAHYAYTLAYHRVYAEMLPQPAAGGGFLLCRSGRFGDQKYASVIWPGDMDSTFTKNRERFQSGGKWIDGVGGLPATVIQGLSLSASGFPFFGADTGGFRHSPADNELFIRWFEQTSLSAVMQIGDSSSQAPWEFTPENGRDTMTLDLYRRYTRLHLRLFPYAWTYAQAIVRDGHPIVRPFGLAYPELGQHPSDQYMFGDDLLVAPVLERGATQRSVFLPPGIWIDFWDGTSYDGGVMGQRLDVPAPIDRLPLFARAGALIPLLRPTIDTLAPATDPLVESFANDAGPLSVFVVPADKSSEFVLWDGTSLSQSAMASELHLKPGKLFNRGAVFQVVLRTKPTQVQRNGADLVQVADAAALDMASSGWYYDRAGFGALWIKLPTVTDEQILTVH